jgi:hypothetical protein
MITEENSGEPDEETLLAIAAALLLRTQTGAGPWGRITYVRTSSAPRLLHLNPRHLTVNRSEDE